MSPTCSLRTQGPWFPVLWQYCQFSMDFFQFLKKNLAIYTDVTVIRPLKCQNEPFVSHLLAKNLGPLIPSVEAILPDFDGFLSILSKLNYLHRCNRHVTTKMPKLALCLPPARWGHRGPWFPVLWQYCQFSMDFFQFHKKTLTIYTDVTVIRPLKCQSNPLSPTCSLRTKGPWFWV